MHKFVRPFPIGPVVAIADERGLDSETLGRLLGAETVTSARQTWHRAKTFGALTVDEADRIACRLGYHPAHLWPDYWWQVVPDDPWPVEHDGFDPHRDWIVHQDRRELRRHLRLVRS